MKILEYFPIEIGQLIQNNIEQFEMNELEEIRIRVSKPIILKLANREKIINYKVSTQDILKILENITDSDTSYTVNKGEKIILCLADRENDNLYSYNLLMYVLIHELAHILNTTYGHDDNFKKTFRFILEKAIELNLYTYEDYKNNPVNYCGLVLNTNIMD